MDFIEEDGQVVACPYDQAQRGGYWKAAVAGPAAVMIVANMLPSRTTCRQDRPLFWLKQIRHCASSRDMHMATSLFVYRPHVCLDVCKGFGRVQTHPNACDTRSDLPLAADVFREGGQGASTLYDGRKCRRHQSHLHRRSLSARPISLTLPRASYFFPFTSFPSLTHAHIMSDTTGQVSDSLWYMHGH